MVNSVVCSTVISATESGKTRMVPTVAEAGCSFIQGSRGGAHKKFYETGAGGERDTTTASGGLDLPGCSALGPFSKVCNFCFQMFRMALLLLPLWLLPLTGGSQRAEPMFTAVTNSVLPPDYDSNPTQLNYGVAVTDVDHDGDFEIVVAG